MPRLFFTDVYTDVLVGFVLGLSWVADIDLLLKLQGLFADFSR